MDVLAYCRAMAAFCRQRGVFEGESDAFWSSEAAEWDKLTEYASPLSQLRTRTSSPEEERTIGVADRILSAAGSLQVHQTPSRISP
jgi:hypothetical protein